MPGAAVEPGGGTWSVLIAVLWKSTSGVTSSISSGVQSSQKSPHSLGARESPMSSALVITRDSKPRW